MRTVLVILLLAAMAPTQAVAQQGDVLFMADFEDDTCGFISGDPAADLTVTNDPDLVFAGRGSLQLEYVQEAVSPDGPGRAFPGALFVLLPGGDEAIGRIAFALTSAISTPVVVVLIENDDGPRYSCVLWCDAGTWNEYSLTPDDFIFDREGPPDPNGRLDPSLVTALALFDADSFVRMLTQSTPLFHLEPPAEQTLWLDEFAVLTGAGEAAPEVEGPALPASYSRPMSGFLILGGRDVTVASEEQADGAAALRIDYTVPERTLFAVVHTIRPGALEGADAIRFHARTNRKVTLVVSLDERRGPGDVNKSTYYTSVQLEPGDEFEMITLPLSLFELGEDQTDPDGELNPERVDTLSIVDGTAAFENSEVINTLRLLPPVPVD